MDKKYYSCEFWNKLSVEEIKETLNSLLNEDESACVDIDLILTLHQFCQYETSDRKYFNLDYNFLIPRLPLYMDSRIKKINDDEVVVCKITEDLGLTLFNNQNIKIGEIKTELDLFDVLTQVKRKRLEGFYAIDKDNRKHEITRHGTIIGLNSDKRLYEKYLKEIMGF